jgi:hypothetical protein
MHLHYCQADPGSIPCASMKTWAAVLFLVPVILVASRGDAWAQG